MNNLDSNAYYELEHDRHLREVHDSFRDNIVSELLRTCAYDFDDGYHQVTKYNFNDFLSDHAKWFDPDTNWLAIRDSITIEQANEAAAIAENMADFIIDKNL